jgi:CheY-like chemotaxis protein
MALIAQHRKVLVLNDNPSIRNLVSLLKDLGREDTPTESGERLLASLIEEQFQAVVLDMRCLGRKIVEEIHGIGEIRAERVGTLLVIVVEVNGPKTLDLLERYILNGLPGALLWLVSYRYQSPRRTHST